MGQESSHELLDDSVPTKTLKARNINAVADLIKEGKVKRIVVLTGAGLSTAAGIPDFRSPDTGLYANLARLDLPYAEAVFDISYFRENPRPFYALAKELYPGKYKPTLAHCFIALLAEKDLLYKLFTQNIDCLERAAGVPNDLIVEAHGSFARQRCIECGTEYPDDLMMKMVENGDIPHCLVPQCNGLVKPDIVFFGESLPEAFGRERPKVAQADLVIIMGTSLSVQPFASLPEVALEGVPRLLLNRERVGGLGSRPDDVSVLADCDDGVRQLVDALGWRDELDELWMKRAGKNTDDIKRKEADSEMTKDERLQAEISKLADEVDQTLKISHNHKEWLEGHLEKNAHSGKSVPDSKDVEERKISLEHSENALNVRTVEDSKGATTKEDEPLVASAITEKIKPESSPASPEESIPTQTESSIDAQEASEPVSADSKVPTPQPPTVDLIPDPTFDKQEENKAPGSHI